MLHSARGYVDICCCRYIQKITDKHQQLDCWFHCINSTCRKKKSVKSRCVLAESLHFFISSSAGEQPAIVYIYFLDLVPLDVLILLKWYTKGLVILKQFTFMLELGFILVNVIASGKRDTAPVA